jgi:hypothetical protein
MQQLMKEEPDSGNLLARWLAHHGISSEQDIARITDSFAYPTGIANRQASSNGLVHAEV